MQPTRRTALLSTIVPAVLAACGTSPQAAVTSPGDHSGKLTLVLTGGEQQHPRPILEGFKTRFPKLTVETVEGAWTQTLDKVTEMVVAGSAPDVWYGENGRATGWGPNGWIQDLTPFVKRDLKESDVFPVAMPKDPDGKIWGVAGDLQVTTLFYNTSAFAEVGLKPPTPDWKLDDLSEAARRLTDPSKKQFGFYAQPNYITTSWYLFPKLFGTSVLDDTLRKSQFNAPRVLQAYQALMAFAEKGWAPPYADQAKYPFAPAATSEGRCAMSFGIYGAMAGPAYKDLPFDVELIPAGPGGRAATVISNAWVIGKGSSQSAASWEWVKWHSQADQQTLRARAGTGLPMNRKAAEEVVTGTPPPPKNRRAFLKSLDFAGTLGENAVWQEWRTVAQAELVKAFNGSVPLPNALAEAHRLTQVELDKFYKR